MVFRKVSIQPLHYTTLHDATAQKTTKCIFTTIKTSLSWKCGSSLRISSISSLDTRNTFQIEQTYTRYSRSSDNASDGIRLRDYVRFEVFTAMKKIQAEVFWIVTPCRVLVGYHQRFRGPCSFHFQWVVTPCNGVVE